MSAPRWLRCSSCGDGVPEPDAIVTCLECGDGMAFTANAAASAAAVAVSAANQERLAFLIYFRCGDRSVATALEDAAVILRGLSSSEPIPDWFAAEYAALREALR